MPMEINNGMMMEPTDNIEVFQQLYDYIGEFDKEWCKKILPASKTMIESLKIVSEIQNKCDDLPPLYKMFLEHMGRDDGGLLSLSQNGTVDIFETMDLYEDHHKFCPKAFCSPYFGFFQMETGVELAFNISNRHEENIFTADEGEIYCVTSESFKKFLFQSAFSQFERFHNYIKFGSSFYDVEQAMLRSGQNNITNIVDDILMKYGLTKVWFSDSTHYIALGVETSLYIDWGYGASGFITSSDADMSKKVFRDLTRKLGVSKD